jgi:glucose-1-phosphate thymidylyltransferase
MKCVILCGGEGKRASGFTHGENKCLTSLPGYGRIINYSLNTAAGLSEEIIVLTGYRGDEVRNYIDNYMKTGFANICLKYAVQPNQLGICNGLLCCESLLNGQDFILFLGDEYLTKTNHLDMIKDFHDFSAFAACGFVYASNHSKVKQTYSINVSGKIITEIKEKPTFCVNNMMGTGNCIFKFAIFDYIRGINDEHLAFPDALQVAINNNETVVATEIGESYLNLNSEDDIDDFLKKYKENGI